MEIVDCGPTLEVDLELELDENRRSSLNTWSTSSPTAMAISTALVALLAVPQRLGAALGGALLDTGRPPHGSRFSGASSSAAERERRGACAQ